MNDKIQLKRGTLANWLKADPVLMDGEMALVATDALKPTTYDKQKVGDGVHKFSELPMLGYECLQELGDSQQFPMSQKAITDWINKGYQFRGIATPSTNPGTPDGPVFYIATKAGTYSNFSGITINTDEAALLVWNGGAMWKKEISGFVSVQSIKDKGAVETYFYLHNLKLTTTTISFNIWSHLYIKDLTSNNYKRYIIKPGTYNLPTNASEALYVSLDIKDENGYLIPTSGGIIGVNLETKCYLIGFVSTFDNKFVLSDAVSIYQVNSKDIASEIARAKAAEEANLAAIQANSNDISTEVTRAKAAEELNSQAINILKEKTKEISKEVVEDENEEIIIEDDNNQELLHFKNGKLRVQEIETQKLNLTSSLNTDINVSSDNSITIENGRCCSFIEGGSYLIKGTGNATINVSFTNKTFADVSYGFMWSWNSQLIASLNVQGITIGKYDSGSPATYKLQGGTFQRINKHDSSSNAVFEVNSDSAETWSLLITKKAEKFIKPSVKPICIVYDGGRWQGQVYWEGELYKIWDLHRKLDIPYAVALYSDQMNPESGNEYTCDEVRRDIETGLCEVIIRNAGVTKTTDLEYLETIESERSLLEVKSKATILTQHILNPLIYRCSIKDGADFIRQYTSFSDTDGVIAYKYSDSSYKAIHSMGFPTILNETNNFWLPEIFWAHGVGIPPEGDTVSYMYGDTTGVNTEKWFKNILPLVENGKVQILHPSDFSQYCRNIK